MFADLLPIALLVVAGLLLLLVVGLVVDAIVARKSGHPPAARRPRPRFVQTLINATIRRRRDKDSDTRSGPEAH